MGGDENATDTGISITPRQALFSIWAMYLLADVVALNLLVEFVPSIVIDSFYISILTAVLLRLMIGLTLQLEHRLRGFFRRKNSTVRRILGGVTMYAILFGSKFVILEVVDIVFADHVELGGFFEIVAIALTLMGVEIALRQIFDWLGRTDRVQ